MGSGEEGPRASAPDAERLYDLYLDACLAGDAEPAAEFLARHGVADEALRRRLEAVDSVRADAATRADPPDPGPSLARVGPYRLLRRVGEGGMGTVWLAEHAEIGQQVALKVIRAEFQESRTASRRFEREAKTIAQLRHENVVRIHDAGREGASRWIAMEWIPGRLLEDLARSERLDAGRVLRWGAALARALAHVHEHGVVHRDVKPSNILVTPDDRPVLLDFGVAHLVDAQGSRLTQTFAGSPAYAAPEQVTGETEVDRRTDVYGLGATLYEALAGASPFGHGTVAEILHRVLVEDPPPLARARPDLDPGVDRVLRKAMEKRPGDRYADAGAFAADLEALAARRAPAARPPSALARAAKWARRRPVAATVLAGAAATLLVAGGVWAWRAAEAAGERRSEARRLFASAEAALARYREERLSKPLEERLAHLDVNRRSGYVPPSAEREYHALLAETVRRRRENEARFHEAIEWLARAERLDPSLRGDGVRARLYFERVEEARARDDAQAVSVYEDLVARHDADGRLVASLRAPGRLTVATDPPGARVRLFRFSEAVRLDPEDGEDRLVPVPLGGSLPTRPGAWALRVVRDAGALRAGDVILEVDGRAVGPGVFALADAGDARRGDRLRAVGDREIDSAADLRHVDPGRETTLRFERPSGESVSVDEAPEDVETGDVAALARKVGATVRLVRDGTSRTETVPPWLRVRATAAPWFPGPDETAESAPIEDRALEPAVYAVHLRLAGHEDAVVPLAVRPDSRPSLRVRLLPAGSTPYGFVRVVPADGPQEWFWIQEHEVTCAEWLEYLEDPATRAEIDRSERPIRYPRNAQSERRGSWWVADDEAYAIPAPFGPRHPVLGVSWEDAQAYARWRSVRDRRRYALPTHAQFLAAAGSPHRAHVFGNAFSPHWASGAFARRKAFPEPVLSFPVDESPYGVYDLAGSASEWVEDWYDDTRGLRRLAGGNWASGDLRGFGVYAGYGLAPWNAGFETGLRLAIVPEREAGR